MKRKWRILPKQFGEYNGKKIFEIEQICVETNTMNFEDYLECRNYSFILRLISSQTFLPIYKLAKELDISWFEISLKLSELVQDKNFKGKLKDIFDNFCKESHEELFETQKEAIDFYSKDENYDKLFNGDIGDNLLGKYSALGLLNITDIISTIFYVIRNKFNIKMSQKFNHVLDSSEKWLKNLYIIENIFDKDLFSKKKQNIKFDFDFPSWLDGKDQSIDNFIKHCEYEFSTDVEKMKYFKRELDVISAAKPAIALGKYLTQQGARSFDVFEKQYTKIH